MKEVSPIVKKFFEDFERGSNTFESDLIASQFSDSFMAADPDGGIQVVKKDDFLAGIAKRQAFFHSIGFQFVKIGSPSFRIPLANSSLKQRLSIFYPLRYA